MVVTRFHLHTKTRCPEIASGRQIGCSLLLMLGKETSGNSRVSYPRSDQPRPDGRHQFIRFSIGRTAYIKKSLPIGRRQAPRTHHDHEVAAYKRTITCDHTRTCLTHTNPATNPGPPGNDRQAVNCRKLRSRSVFCSSRKKPILPQSGPKSSFRTKSAYLPGRTLSMVILPRSKNMSSRLF
jgi:hypothetical protein